MKKLLAIVLAVTLVASLSGVALAAFPHVTDTPQYTQVKVAQVPIPWQFWAIEIDPDTGAITVIDRIRISPTWLTPPPGQPPGAGDVFIQRQVAVVPGPGNFVPLEELVWGAAGPVPNMAALEWKLVDVDPIEVPIGRDIVLPIPVTEGDGAVLVAYEVYKESAPGSGVPAAEPDGHFINEAILESSSPQAIVQILVNFDIHNGTGRDDITNFELDFFGLNFEPEDVVWALGFVVGTGEPWGANEDNPLVVRPITGGTEVKWVQPDRPLHHSEWLHVGLAFNYADFGSGISATVQGYWTVLLVPVVDIDIKPGSDPNSINLNGNGVVPVGVFGTATFDVNDINVGTVRFGVLGTEAAAVHSGHIEDLNGDGIDDMVLHFREGELRIDVNTPGNTTLDLLLTGELDDGSAFEGKDEVRITPNNPDKSRGKGGKGPK